MPDTAISRRFDAGASLYWSTNYDQRISTRIMRPLRCTPDFVDETIDLFFHVVFA
jgi:hypothetical protein